MEEPFTPPVQPGDRQSLQRKKFFVIVLLLGAIHLFLFGVLAFFFRPTPEPVVLRYNIYFGIDTLSAWWQVYLVPLLSLLFVSANLLLAYRFLRAGQRLVSILLLLGSGVVSIGLVIAVISIVFINY